MAGPYTMSELGAPSGAHTGVQWNGGVVTISATTTAAALVYLCRVPNHCVIMDWYLYSDQPGLGTNQTIEIGTSASNSAIAAAFSLSQTASAGDTELARGNIRPRGADNLLPVKISLSDDMSIDQNVWLTLKFNAAPTTSASNAILRFGVYYVNSFSNITAHNTTR